MKRTTYITAILITTVMVIVSSCDSKRQPGKIYMPDMAYSRAYETYAERNDSIFTTDADKKGDKIFYNNMPVTGTIQRGELFPFTVPNDSNGLIVLSAQIKNPMPPLNHADSLEAGRLFNINCAVCHGPKAENNGPLAPKIGGVKSIIATSPGYADGRIFFVMTYGQNNMGSYASQLDRRQRWMIVQYIRTLEPKATAAPAVVTTAAKDSTAKPTVK
ncbi:MAG: cytochrome c [Sphingobacteriales bacterium]|nr:cytochrome c [Sphingobacteriales bacterium]